MHEQAVDVFLLVGMMARRLADRDAHRVFGRDRQHGVGDEPVVDDDVGARQGFYRLQGEQLGIARSGADQRDVTFRHLNPPR